jgi:hypothetical protein
MPNLIERLNKARGVSNTVDSSIQENIRREAQTRQADYASISIETRPWVPACLNMDDCRRLLVEYNQKRKPATR